MTNKQIYEGELAKLRAQNARDEEHYRASQAMSEKHRKNWVEASQERDRLRAMPSFDLYLAYGLAAKAVDDYWERGGRDPMTLAGLQVAREDARVAFASAVNVGAKEGNIVKLKDAR